MPENVEQQSDHVHRTYVDASVHFVGSSTVTVTSTGSMTVTKTVEELDMRKVFEESHQKLTKTGNDLDEKIKKLLRTVGPQLEETEKAKVEIVRVPGYQLLGFLSTICSKKFVERELTALVEDGVAQYQELLATGNTAGAQRWKWSMRLGMIRTVFGGAINPLLRMVGIIRKLSE